MTWPAVFNGRGALTVDSTAFDPDVLADRIPGLTWVAQKVGGTDSGTYEARQHNAARWRARGITVGNWVFCTAPLADYATAVLETPSFVIYDVEQPYKSDEGGQYEYAGQLVAMHSSLNLPPAAVTSYGGYKSSIDFAAFARAGWPIFAQVYDAFKPGDELTYWDEGPYPADGIHRLTRSLSVGQGEAVFRPESIDG